ncbi:hypothetical protein [Streptomyces sp. NPDC021356]|uniref:hypothetical protein n=1 Tax=Streptomyces sp. NPDC021356 TaxID=3154900 RepID=UPI0033C98566
MVDRLTAEGVLTDSLLRDALLRLPREVLLPHAYVRVSGPGAAPIDWRLLDGSHPDDRQEWLDLIHSDESILLQRDGEPLDALPRGPVTGGHMTSMSTYTPATIEVLQAMELGSGQRYLELGPGPGVSLALAAAITGPGLATGVERDGHMAAFAQRNLDRLGVGAEVIEGDALEGHEARAPYDRIHSGIGVPCVPAPWVEQLAPGGQLLTTLATRTPSWPGQLLVTRTADSTVEALLRGRPRGYRPLLGYRWLNAVDHRAPIKYDPGTARSTRLTPPPDEAYGFWLAAAYLAPGLVRDFQAETMTIVAPEDDSWPWLALATAPSESMGRVTSGLNLRTSTRAGSRPDGPSSTGSTYVTASRPSTSPPARARRPWPGRFLLSPPCPGRCHDRASSDRRRTACPGLHRPGGGGQPAQALTLPLAQQPHSNKELRMPQPPNPLHPQAVSPAVQMADRVTACGATVGITGDGSLWTYRADWTAALKQLIQSYLGEERRAGTGGVYAGPGRRYEDDLADSAFSEVTEHSFPLSRLWAPGNVIGYLRTTSFARPAQFAGRLGEFEAAALRLLQDHADGGVLKQDAVFTVLLACRPGGAA